MDAAALGEELRAVRGGALEVRVLTQAELEAVVGPARLAPFDDSFGVLELSSTTAIPSDVAFDVQFASVRVARTLVDDLGLYHELRGVLRLPPPPRDRVVTTPNALRAALGVVGIVTLVTPIASIVSGQDAVSPLLQPDEELIVPTEEEWTRWRADPALEAARRLQAFLRERDGRCDGSGTCALRVLVIGPERGTFDVTALRVKLRYLTHGGNGASCAVDDRVLVRLPKGPAVGAQVRAAFGQGGLALSSLQSARRGRVARWWSGAEDAEQVARDDGE